MSDRHVVGMRIAGLERAHYHLAGIYADANFDRYSAALEKSVAVRANVLVHAECGMNCALRVIFVRSRSAEDAVASVLHVAVIVAGSIDHSLQCRIDDRAGFLGIELRLQQ